MRGELFPVVGGALQQISRLRCIPAESEVSVPELQRELSVSLEEAVLAMRALQFAEQDIQDTLYALVAHADEVALTSSDALRRAWLSLPLQRSFFGENNAGENFFFRLDAIRRDPQRRHVSFAYYLCLLLGFQGVFLVSGRAGELAGLKADLRRELGDLVEPPKALASHGHRPALRAPDSGAGRRFLRISALALLGSVLLFLMTQVALHRVATGVAAKVSTATDVSQNELLRRGAPSDVPVWSALQ